MRGVCECAVLNSAASGRAEGFPAPLLRSGLGERARHGWRRGVRFMPSRRPESVSVCFGL